MPFASMFLLVLAMTMGPSPAVEQTPAPGACSLLTKELALKVTPSANKRVFDLMKPEEEQVGGGTACEYGDIRIQILPGATEPAKQSAAPWTPVANVGDRAWYRPNRTEYAELVVVIGKRTLTIQMSVPAGGTPEAVKPKAIELANALVPKLK